LVGKRHNLQFVKVMDEQGVMNENAGEYRGLDRFKCREELVENLKREGLLEKVEDHLHSVGRCQRCHTVIEPYLSEQWFVRMKPLARPALEAVRIGRIKFYPDKWIKTYEHWMENIRDWCISRQLWWGHRIPVFYCQNCGEMMVAREKPESCSSCAGTRIKQDEDVLDTWFSSWLWPFSTLGWPEETDELRYFYPTNTLVTGADIIFFWVARMIMAGLEFMGDVPFREVYFHGIIRDEFGRKMSKSLGNGIDPLEMVEKYSADAVRFSLIMLSTEGQDINLAERNFEIGRNFLNKVWNAYRFLALNSQDIKPPEKLNYNELKLEDRWILSRFNRTIMEVTGNLERFRLHDAVERMYNFFWGDFCDWYLEVIKDRLYGGDDSGITAISAGLRVLEGSMKLLHPFIPFLSEEIWNRLNDGSKGSVMVSSWPAVRESEVDLQVEKRFEFLQKVVGTIRNIRGEMNVEPSMQISIICTGEDADQLNFLISHSHYLERLAKVKDIETFLVPGPVSALTGKDHEKLRESGKKLSIRALQTKRILDAQNFVKKLKYSAVGIVEGMNVYVPLKGIIDIEKERKRIKKEISEVGGRIAVVEGKLSNREFISKAPAHVVQKEREKEKAFRYTLEKLKLNLSRLED
ncbi:MAG: valine--tRNA ligase, partial [Fidelibacterota bacterium]